MRIFWTIFWTFLLIQMLTYVVSSMIGVAYDFNTGLILSIGTSILVLIVPLILPNEPTENNGHH